MGIITSLLCQNDVATSFWRNNDVIITTSCVHWEVNTWIPSSLFLFQTRFVIAMGVVSILAVFVTTALTLDTLVEEFQLLVYQDTDALIGAYNNTE